MDTILEVLLRATGLTVQQQKLILKVGAWTVVWVHILWVCGWLAFMGVEAPFARAQIVSDAVAMITADRVERLDHDILQLRMAQCKATTPEAKDQYGERLTELITKYQQITRREPRVPHCDEV